MDYQRIYNSIIERAKTRIIEGYTEKHHIIPRCMGGSNNDDNLVALTPEEHYVCHLLLIKLYPGNIGLVKAAMFLTSSNNNVRRNNKLYGWLKRQYSDYMRGPNNPQKLNPRKGERHHTYNRKIKFNFTEKGRKVLSEKMVGDKNPCSGIKPWNHPRATDYTRSIWAKADEIYNLWIANKKPSYCKLHSLVNGRMYDNVSVGPFMNMVKYFRNGWIPTEDLEWKKFNEQSTV